MPTADGRLAVVSPMIRIVLPPATTVFWLRLIDVALVVPMLKVVAEAVSIVLVSKPPATVVATPLLPRVMLVALVVPMVRVAALAVSRSGV